MVLHAVGQLSGAGDLDHPGRHMEVAGVDVAETGQHGAEIILHGALGNFARVDHVAPKIHQAFKPFAAAE